MSNKITRDLLSRRTIKRWLQSTLKISQNISKKQGWRGKKNGPRPSSFCLLTQAWDVELTDKPVPFKHCTLITCRCSCVKYFKNCLTIKVE